MPTKLRIVTEFTRDELWAVIDYYDLPVEDRRRLDHLHAAVRRLPKSELREILLSFDRDRLKTICRRLDMDDGGKLKAEIVDRLVGGNNDDSTDTSFENETAAKSEPDAKAEFEDNAQLLNCLVRDELLYIIDRFGFSVEDRRRREDLVAAAVKVSDSDLAAVLEQFPRDRLKELCRLLDRDDSGKRKDEIVGRMLSERNKSHNVNSTQDREMEVTPTPEVQPNFKQTLPSPRVTIKPDRPRLFIGSTVEALPVARDVQAELHREFQVTIWNQSLFTPGDSTWSRLVEMARCNFDFALLVFSADDVVESRGGSALAPRDNVLLEYGLFVGALGPDRTFFLYNHDHPPKIASDLAGVTALTYGDRDDDNMQAAVGPACTGLRKRNTKLGRLLR